MSSWATRRKLMYASFGMLLAAILGPLLWYAYPKPSCSDGKRNQDEQGIDCGGSCARICAAATQPLRVLWTRSFFVAPGVASGVAFILNPNPTFGAEDVSYRLRLYDAQNILIAERRGEASVPPNAEFPIFEGGISVGNRIPVRAFLEFTEEPAWRISKGTPPLSISNQRFDERALVLEADVTNPDVGTVRGIEAVGVVYDEEDNAIGASKTVIDRIPGGGTAHVVFTWLLPFASPPVAERIYLLAPQAE